MGDEWGPWIEHGREKSAPRFVVVGMYINVDGFNGNTCGFVEQLDNWTGVDRFRIRKPRGLTILEEIAQGIREPEDA